ncbi:MAG: ABC transporter substrate-binding protein [Thermomicrobiales bacterium]|nr:ABC transporter substrate-binding protein [Thermomicrobiales bacterium]
MKPVGGFGPFTKADGSPDPQVGNLDVAQTAWLGDWDGFDAEKLFALQPDLLVGLDLPDVPNTLWYIPEDLYPVISERVPTVGFRLAPEEGVTGLFGHIENLATALGADLTAAEQMAARDAFDVAVNDVREAVAEKPGLQALVVSADSDSMYVANPDWFGDIAFFRSLGLDIIAPDTTDRWQELGWEEAGRYQPDLYLVDARAGDLPPELADIATWQAQPAVKAGQVAPWRAVYPYSRQAFTPILEELASAIRATNPDVAP